MNNQMDDFSIAPGVPNAFGLIGTENNSVAPGKRPLSSMSPTIVLKNGQPILAVGVAGGPKIISQLVWAIIHHLDLNQDIGHAIAVPRVHHQWSPDRLLVESSLPVEQRDGLAAKGHPIVNSETVGITQAIAFGPDANTFYVAHDPRIPGKSAGQ